jgi:hypothetical protein
MQLEINTICTFRCAWLLVLPHIAKDSSTSGTTLKQTRCPATPYSNSVHNNWKPHVCRQPVQTSVHLRSCALPPCDDL